jgi:hypothetical protein
MTITSCSPNSSVGFPRPRTIRWADHPNDGTLDGNFLSREVGKFDRGDPPMTQGQNTPVDVVNFYNKYHYEVTQVPILGGSYTSFEWVSCSHDFLTNRISFIDPLVFCVHPSNPIDYLTLQQIDSIMSVTRNRGGADISYVSILQRRGF